MGGPSSLLPPGELVDRLCSWPSIDFCDSKEPSPLAVFPDGLSTIVERWGIRAVADSLRSRLTDLSLLISVESRYESYSEEVVSAVAGRATLAVVETVSVPFAHKSDGSGLT